MEAQSHPIRILLVEAAEDDFLSVIDLLLYGRRCG
jgi:hypothetical protein